jgi:hypothetical protein
MPMERQGDAFGISDTHTSPHYPSVCVLCVVGRRLWRHSTGSRHEAAEEEAPSARKAKGEGDTPQATTPGGGHPKARFPTARAGTRTARDGSHEEKPNHQLLTKGSQR